MDIKPDNIMLDKDGKVKLIDYDNAVEGNAGLTVESGSPLYAAPEQYNREKAVIQSDIVWGWSFYLWYLMDIL